MKKFHTAKNNIYLFYSVFTLVMTATYIFAIWVYGTYNTIIIPIATLCISLILFYFKIREDKRNIIEIKNDKILIILNSIKAEILINCIECFAIVSDIDSKNDTYTQQYTEEDAEDVFLVLKKTDKNTLYYCINNYAPTTIENLVNYLVKIGLKEVVTEDIK